MLAKYLRNIAAAHKKLNYHREMYALKRRHNWAIEGSPYVIHVDTAVSSMMEKTPFSVWWHAIVTLVGVGMVILPENRSFYGSELVRWILPGTQLLMITFIWGFHGWIVARHNVVYSMDTDVNIKLIQLEKRTWSWILLSSNI